MTPELTTAHAALDAAKAKRREVQKRLDAELSMSNDARKDAAAAHLKLDLARLSAITPASAHVRAAKIRDAEIDAEAQDHEVARAEGYIARVTAELADATRGIAEAAQSFKRQQARQWFTEYLANRRCAQLLRVHLLGAYLADPGALADKEWVDVAELGDATVEAMNIGMPLVGESMFSPKALGGDTRQVRQRVDEAQRRYQSDLAELAADDADEQAAA